MSYHDILNVVLFNLKKILTLTIPAVFFLFVILLFVYPRTYRSPVSILPPEKNQSVPGLGSLLSGADIGSLLTGGMTSANSQLYIEILKSRSAAEYVVKKHNLVEYFDADDVYEACKELNEQVNIDLNKEGIIKLSVDVTTPILPLLFGERDSTAKLASILSNSFVEALDKLNRDKLSSKAKNARKYLEEQIIITKTNLDSAEVSLMQFQQNNKAVALPEQLKAVIEGASKIKSEIVETEIQIELLGTNLREGNKTLLGLRNQLENLEKQYAKLEIGSEDYLLAFKDVPELSREFAVLLRNVKIQNEVYLILQQQYYKEKIQENKDIPTIEVLDKAIVPKKASSPRILYSSFFGGIFIFLCITLFFIVSEGKSSGKNKDRN